MRALKPALLALLMSACTLPHAAETLASEAPPPELGRPGWVRESAGAGAWVGGVFGGVAAVVLLPVTYPLSVAAAEPLGYSEQEVLFAPITMFASAGHFLVGAPLDMIDFTVRRAWEDEPAPYDYEHTPAAAPPELAPAEDAAPTKN